MVFSRAGAGRPSSFVPVFRRPRVTASGLNAWTDEDLLGGYRETGDPSLFHELVRRFEGGLLRHLVRVLGDESAAEDVLQTTWMHLHERRGSYRDGRPARPWIFAIASHLAVDSQRYAVRHSAVSLDRLLHDAEGGEGGFPGVLLCRSACPLEALIQRERREWVRRGLERLPSRLRTALANVYDRGQSQAEFAREEGVALGTVKSRIHDALERLRRGAAGSHLDDDQHEGSAFRPRIESRP